MTTLSIEQSMGAGGGSRPDDVANNAALPKRHDASPLRTILPSVLTRSLISSCVALLAIVSGCAIQQGNGRITFRPDEPEIFGETVSTFRLGDGSEGSLRRYQVKYSLKLHNKFKVIPIEGADAHIAHVQNLGDRTVLVIDKQTSFCAGKTDVLSIKGGEVFMWDLGSCSVAPRVSFAGDSAAFDFQRIDGSVLRFLYQDARMYQVILPPQSAATKPARPAVTPGATASTSPKPAAPAPTTDRQAASDVKMVSTSKGHAADPEPPASAPKPRRNAEAPVKAPPAPRALSFPDGSKPQEQQRVVIRID